MLKFGFLIVSILGLTGSSVNADDFNWTGATSRDWNTPTNWSPPTNFPGGGVTTDTVILENNPGLIDITAPVTTSMNGINVNAPGFEVNNFDAMGPSFNGFGLNTLHPFLLTNQLGGNITFNNSASAGNTTITNFATGITAGIKFNGNSQATDATIINNGTLKVGDALGPRTSTFQVGALSGDASGIVSPGGSDSAISVGHLNQDSTYHGAFENAGPSLLSVNKVGTGTLVLTGVSTHSGGTDVREGTLQVDGQLNGAAATSVFQNARLTGTGQVILLANGGVVEPGNPSNRFGSLDVGFYQSGPEGGTVNIHVSPLLNSRLNSPFPSGSPLPLGFISLGPSATIPNAGSTMLNLVFEPGRYNKGTEYDIVTAGINILGEFVNIPTAPPRLIPSLFYKGKTVTLTVRERSFGDIWTTFFGGGTGNEQELINAWDVGSNDPNISDDFNAIVGSLNLFTLNQLRNTFRAVGSASFTNGPRASFQNANLISRIVQNQGIARQDLGSLVRLTHTETQPVTDQSVSAHAFARDSVRHKPFVQNLSQKSSNFDETALALKDQYGHVGREMARNIAAHHPGKGQLWMQGFTGKTDVRDDLNKAPGFDARTHGAMMGMDYGVDDTLRIGVGAGYMKTRIDHDHMRGRNDLTGPFASLWGCKAYEDFEVDAAIFFHRTEQKTRRNIFFPGVSRVANAEFKGYVLMPHLGAAYNFDSSGYHIKPFIGFDLFMNHENAFVETGANSLNLSIRKRDAKVLQTSLGLGVDKHICLSTGVLRPEVKVAYRNRAHLEDDGVPGTYINQRTLFTSRRPTEMLHRVGVHSEMSYAWHNGRHVKIGYQGDFGHSENAHMGFVSVGMSW